MPVINEMFPRRGSFFGGTRLTIIGHDFTNSTVCKFGDVVVSQSAFIDSEKIQCISPLVSQPGLVRVEVSNDGIHFTRQLFEYLFQLGSLACYFQFDMCH